MIINCDSQSSYLNNNKNDDVAREGKFSKLGLSNYSGWLVNEVLVTTMIIIVYHHHHRHCHRHNHHHHHNYFLWAGGESVQSQQLDQANRLPGSKNENDDNDREDSKDMEYTI